MDSWQSRTPILTFPLRGGRDFSVGGRAGTGLRGGLEDRPRSTSWPTTACLGLERGRQGWAGPGPELRAGAVAPVFTGTGCARYGSGPAFRLGHSSLHGTGDGLPSGVASGKGRGQLPSETKRLEISVSFWFFCSASSDFVAGRSAFLVTDATDFGLDESGFDGW